MTDNIRFSRRNIMAAPAIGFAAALTSKAATAAPVSDDQHSLEVRRDLSTSIRTYEADRSGISRITHHPSNTDEDDITENGQKTYIANYTKGLLHNKYGEVVPERYQRLLTALESGLPDDFENITLSDLTPGTKPAALTTSALSGVADLVTRPDVFFRLHSEASLISADIQRLRLVNPQAGLAFDLEGPDSHALAMPAPPSFRSKEILGEIAENYWMAILRDVPFSQYPGNITITNALASLNEFTVSRWPKTAGTGGVTSTDTIFRGNTDGDLIGPYVSQFLIAPIPFGAYQFDQKIVFSFVDPASGKEPVFMTSAILWLDAQNGKVSSLQPTIKKDKNGDVISSYIHRGRDLCNFVHIDELFQAYLNAALLMGAPPLRNGYGVQHNSGNPYDGFDPNEASKHRRSTQGGFGTLGEPAFKSMVAEIATRALKAVWYQKWFVHRRLRPEVFAGRVHFHKMKSAGLDGKSYPFDGQEFGILENMLDAVKAFNMGQNGDSTYFLPMAFPEGSPAHPTYGAGHATVAGACVTLLKGFYEGSMTYEQLNAPIYEVDSTGQQLTDVRKSRPDLAKTMTIGGELNKLASNISIGRNFSGVHWRSDHIESLRLGESVALKFLQEIADTHNENAAFNLTKFDGTKVQISKSQ